MQTLTVTITNINDKTLGEANRALKVIDSIFHIGERDFNGEISINLEVIGNAVSKELLTTIFSSFAMQCTLDQAKV
jgi:hypothetical protein